MIPFFKKDFLVYWRDRKEIIIALLMPMVLITVLGFALPGWVENPAKTLEMKVGLVKLDDEEAGLETLRDHLASLSMSDEMITARAEQMEQQSPVRQLLNVLQEDSVKEIVHLEELEPNEAVRQLKDKKIEAFLTIPAGFTEAALSKMILNDGEGAELIITAEKASMRVDVMAGILDGVLRTMNYQIAVSHMPDVDAEAAAVILEDYSGIGGREILPGVEMVTSFQYYALAISIVFALMISVTIASKATGEKRERVFERILLTGSHPLNYLSGKMGSTFCLSLLQLVFVLLASHGFFGIFHGRSLQFWIGVTVVLIVLSFCMGSLASLFTTLVFRLEDSVANAVTFITVLIAGTIGGSFVPVYVLPEWLQIAGEWTPNGLTLVALLEWLQIENMNSLTASMLKLGVFSLVIIAIATWSFPRRGRI
ncbi:ABC-2 type transport system permease protein [Fontibacillus phaseoli]|uniref:ABC-2 type transport system permease protein n=1 Tax=Fontibacillus phaseoli TaxID=1416533 RepID=A0A369BSR1_9BACL|nr:ABC transporter permease [Fontibacillus phaseoli]RCX23457.1 ABC-2 type transport system permease protein [Fontibacillus phaseoli]